MAAATLFALERCRDLDTAQTLPTTAQDALDAVVPGAEPAGKLQVRHCEISLGQQIGALWERSGARVRGAY